MNTPTETLLKTTIGRCTTCQMEVPAEVLKVPIDDHEEVIMRRLCPDHGLSENTISTDARFYWLAKGDPKNSSCGCESTCSSASTGNAGYLGRNATDESRLGKLEKLSTCLALIEIVDSCNLACPTCFSDSPVGVGGAKLKCHTFDDITGRIQNVIDRKGKIEIIQFSGGEPTIHPEFFQLARWVRLNPKIDYLVVNTNGVRLANDGAFVAEMGELFRKFDNIQLYLQFDGPQENGQVKLRGRDLRKMRDRAIRNCERIGLPITLAMTVNKENLPHVWDTVEYALPFEHIRGVSFQPEFLSGRNPTTCCGKTLPQPITVADIVLGLNEKSNGLVGTADFTPLPCGDPNCSTIGWLVRTQGAYFSPSSFGINVAALQSTLPDRVNYRLEDLQACGCENTELGDLMKKLESESRVFRMFIKPFMDARTWDNDRTDRCCTHVIAPDGRLRSFCEYYASPLPSPAIIVPEAKSSCC